MIWRYFAWANQTLSVFTLWAITVYLARARKWYGLTLVPALFMTAVCSTYICIAPRRIRIVTLGFVVCDRRGGYTDWSRLVYCLEKRDWILV